jgi:hypothetical protein
MKIPPSSKRHFGASICVIVCTTSVFLSAIAPAIAQSRYLRRAIINQTVTGGKFTARFGQEDLQSPPANAPVICRKEKAAKVTWVIGPASNGVDSEWVEMGSVKGWTNQSGLSNEPTTYHAGSYYARQNFVNNQLSYFRSYAGASGVVGAKNYQINYAGLVAGKHRWNFYVDGSLAGSLDSTRPSFPQVQVGLEASSGYVLFFSPTRSDGLQWRNSSGTWQNWSTSSITGADNPAAINAGWSSAYTGGVLNQVTFTKTSGSAPNAPACP